MTEKNTIIFLMDMDGHDGISDDFAVKYRTYALQDIVNDNFLDRDKNVIVSTPFYSERSRDLYHQATYDRGWKWHIMEKTNDFQAFRKMLEKNNFKLDPENTTMIFGGTNTSGCVLHSSNLSLNAFASRDFYCQLYLPLCDDPMIPGVNSHDRSQKAFVEVYEFIKRNRLWDKIDILTRFASLNLIKSPHKFEFVST